MKMILSKYVYKGVLHIRIKYDSPQDLYNTLEELREEHPTLSEGVIPTKEFKEVLATVTGYSEEELFEYSTHDMVKEVVVEQLYVHVDENDDLDIDNLF